MIKTFAYHKPSPPSLLAISKLREAFSILYEICLVSCPNTRERSVALTKLEETAMWAIESVVFNDPNSEVESLTVLRKTLKTVGAFAPSVSSISMRRKMKRKRKARRYLVGIDQFSLSRILTLTGLGTASADIGYFRNLHPECVEVIEVCEVLPKKKGKK